MENNKILETLHKIVKDVEFHLEKVSINGNISVFFAKTNNAKNLEDKWEDISNSIAIYYQTKLESEYERWNLYVFYLLSEKVENIIKYKIENDTISSRKIIIDNFNFSEINHENVSDIIVNHITNTNLKLEIKNLADSVQFNKNLKISSALDSDFDKSTKSSKADKYTAVLEQIEKNLKNEI